MKRIIFICIFNAVWFLSLSAETAYRICLDSISKDSIYLSIFNKSNKSVYLFDSYLTPDLKSSEYLLINNKDEFIYSFLPIADALSFSYSDRIITGKNKILYSGQILWHFYENHGLDKIHFSIPADVLNEGREYYIVKSKRKYKKKKKLSKNGVVKIVFSIFESPVNVNSISVHSERYKILGLTIRAK